VSEMTHADIRTGQLLHLSRKRRALASGPPAAGHDVIARNVGVVHAAVGRDEPVARLRDEDPLRAHDPRAL